MKAHFVTFEGIEGSGKTTVAEAVYEAMVKVGISVILTREPGGTGLSEDIRRILLDPGRSSISPKSELLLYLASRAQLVEETIRPGLVKGTSVLCDRFMDASVAYQGWARGLGEQLVEDMNAFAVGDTVPAMTFLLDLPVDVGFRRGPEKREGAGFRTKDRLEQEDRSFHERVREGYLRLAERRKERFVVVDATLTLEDVLGEIFRNLEKLFHVKLL